MLERNALTTQIVRGAADMVVLALRIYRSCRSTIAAVSLYGCALNWGRGIYLSAVRGRA